MQNLSGKTAFITGGASGIGLGIAKALLSRGMNLVIADIRDDHLEDAQKELNSPDKVLALKLDVTDRAAFKAAADAAEERFGKIHILVNNAGVAVVGPVEQASYDDWDWTMGVNLDGTINGVVTMLPRILAHGEGGHIVNTASMSGFLPHPGTVIYTTSKAAVIGMAEAMRAELEGRGVIVSAFCPGPVQSNIAEAGKTRPDSMSDTGYAESDKRRQQGGDFFHLYKTKEEIGERVAQGIENDELYILTHSEFTEGVEARTQAMRAAVPDNLPQNEELKQVFAPLFFNQAHADELERQKKLKK
ncbi:SDR family oxidoreductase [Emcibacter nanhaiensis]|uniref:SDR family NAD(P)-dependent oxidoreductase n=1 Tax=Emcibacter nanhaiensis TaxID=1505037 RepID=A0A501PCX3_9PROT|nr:SDR family NAD(P)-dependent oxidoreductase [Emcibacter nanhaiensis]TPD57872.1 SDR family NAD(P)-dependent oxidoreductase [Emcibacter nanhaiensis]